MKKILLALCLAALPLIGCQSNPSNPNAKGAVATARQKLEELPEPTFETVEVYVHDLSVLGTAKLITTYPTAKVPLKALSDSALSVLLKEQASMGDIIALSNSLDEIKEGNIKQYLDIAWTLLEMEGVIRRDDLTAVLTQREQRLVIALFRGINKAVTDANAVDGLNSRGPRW